MTGTGYLLLRSSHWVIQKILARAGYRWEVRRMGDLKIGLWRKSVSSSLPGKQKRPQIPRRLVFIPGFCDSSLSWFGILMTLMSAVKSDYDELVMIELPGYLGVLSREKLFHSVGFLTKVMNDLLNTLQPKAVVGHSLGAWLAASYGIFCGQGHAKKNPELLILVSPPGVFVDDADKERFKNIFERVLETGAAGWREHIFAKEPKWFHWVVPQMDEILRRDETVQFIKSFGDEFELTGKLKNLPMDVRILWGEKDTLLPTSALPIWFEELQNGNWKPYAFVIQGAGHTPQIESPLCTGAALISLLQGKQTSRFKRNQMVVPLALPENEIRS